MKLLVTGGCGFIGSRFVRLLLEERPTVRIVVLDKLTYAGNLANLAGVLSHPSFSFVKGDICDADSVRQALGGGVDAIVNFAAETHVDRSILDSERFLATDVLGTRVLLEAARELRSCLFLQVSTDEVYGDVRPGHSSREDDRVAPRSPYAASKASADLLVLAYAATYSVPVLITRGSNTYGPYQFPEKIIPLFITNLIDDLPVPLYGDGMHERDWLHVDDHARGILEVLERGRPGEVYNLGGGNAQRNYDVTLRLIELCGRAAKTHLQHVAERPGHDRRYSLDCSKATSLGWAPKIAFERGLRETVTWYRNNEPWWRPLKSREFAEYYRRQYATRQTL
jgi:dTDP-glucose 4,6-dehydratase